MKYLIIFLLLASCATPNRIIKQIKKKQVKLESKGVTIPRDTITTIIHDTLIRHYVHNDTIVKELTITKTIQLEPIIEYKTRWQVKKETKTIIKEDKQKTKQIKLEADARIKVAEAEAKKAKAENKGKTWWLLWLGLGLGVGGTLYIKK